MCVYNGRRVSLSEFIRLKEMEKALRSLPTVPFDVDVQFGYDYGEWPIIKSTADKKDFEIVMAHWEFLPPVLPSADHHHYFRKQYDCVNAKSETLLTSSLFRNAARKGRCLVLSSHFYEYRHLPQYGKKGQLLKATKKIPYRISLPGQPYFFMAGISQTTTDQESGEMADSFAIVTTEANSLMRQVHNSKLRMPTILPEDLAYEWVFGELMDDRIKELAGYQFPAEQMEAHPVSKEFRLGINTAERFIYDDVPELVL